MRLLVLLVFLVSATAGVLTGCEQASENAGSTSGPGVEVDCALKKKSKLNQEVQQNLLPGQGGAVGKTEVDVQC